MTKAQRVEDNIKLFSNQLKYKVLHRKQYNISSKKIDLNHKLNQVIKSKGSVFKFEKTIKFTTIRLLTYEFEIF